MGFDLVRPEGFEPPTNGFGSHYSIRLSYERLVGHYARTTAARVTPATRSLPNGRTPLHCRWSPVQSKRRRGGAWRELAQPPGRLDDAWLDRHPAHDRSRAALLPFAA